MFTRTEMPGFAFCTVLVWSMCRTAVSVAPAVSCWTRPAVVVWTNVTSFGSRPAFFSTMRVMTSAKPPGSWTPIFLPFRSARVLMPGPTTNETSTAGAYEYTTFTSAPLAMPSMTGSAEVPASVMPPEAEARSEPTPPSKRTSSTVRFSSLK